MRILYLTSWSYKSGTAVASAWPTIKYLAEHPQVERITYVSLDDNYMQADELASCLSPKVDHQIVPNMSKARWLKLTLRHIFYIKKIKAQRVDLIVCRGASAVPYALSAKKHSAAPLVIESFEPHAGYMVEAGQWPKNGIRERIQTNWEKKATKKAEKIVTVSKGYAKFLVDSGIDSNRIATIPCSADLNDYRPDVARGEGIRQDLGIDGPLCVYSGKFGGIYLDLDTAGRVLQRLRENWRPEKLNFLILSPDPAEKILDTFSSIGLDSGVWAIRAAPDEVPSFLNAADFAISFHRSSKWSFGFSPIKHAEYFASGLPIICPCGIGDDATIIDENDLGFVLDMTLHDQIPDAIENIRRIISTNGYRADVRRRWLENRESDTFDSIFSPFIKGEIL